MSTQITPDQLKYSEEKLQGLRRRIDNAVDSEKRLALAKEIEATEASHRALHQAYTAECQQIALKRMISRF